MPKPGRPRADAPEFERVAEMLYAIKLDMAHMAEAVHPGRGKHPIDGYAIADLAAAVSRLADCCAKLARR